MKGDTGATGATGPAGPTGATGPSGITKVTYGQIHFNNLAGNVGATATSTSSIVLAAGKIFYLTALIHGHQPGSNSSTVIQLNLVPLITSDSGSLPSTPYVDYVIGNGQSLRTPDPDYEQDIEAKLLIDNSAGTGTIRVSFQISIGGGGQFVANGSYFLQEVSQVVKSDMP